MANSQPVYASTMLSEEKVFSWEIKDFRAKVATDFEDVKCEFEVGDRIELPTKWRVFLKKHEESVHEIGIYFDLLESPNEVEKVYASYGYEISASNREDYSARYEFKKSLSGKGEGGAIYLENLNWFSRLNLVNGNLQIKIRFTLHNDIVKDVETEKFKRRTHFQEKLCSNIVDSFMLFIAVGKNTDLTIQMKDGKTEKVHSTILTARSPTFSAILQAQMEDGVVLIEDVSYDAMTTILYFIYTGRVDDDWAEVVQEIVEAAERYEIPLLKEFCDTNLSTICKPNNAFDLLKLVQRHGMKIAENDVEEYIKANIAEILQETLEP